MELQKGGHGRPPIHQWQIGAIGAEIVDVYVQGPAGLRPVPAAKPVSVVEIDMAGEDGVPGGAV